MYQKGEKGKYFIVFFVISTMYYQAMHITYLLYDNPYR